MGGTEGQPSQGTAAGSPVLGGALSGLSKAEHGALSALGDPVAREVLGALSRGDRDVHTLVLETGLPQSSVYRKLKELTAHQIVEIPRLAFTKDGRKVELFRLRLREVRAAFEGGRVRVQVVPREDAAERLDAMWESVRRLGR